MRRSPWAAVAAIVIATALLVLVIPVSGTVAPGSTATPTRAAAPQRTSPAAQQASDRALLQGDAANVSAKLHFSPAQAARFESAVANQSVSSLLASTGLSPADFGAAATAGGVACALSVACAVVVAAAVLVFGYGLQQAGNQALTQYKQWATAMVSSVWDEANITNAGTANLLSALNFSQQGFDRMAENAALLQLGNSSFNIPQDEYQSGLSAQMATIYAAYVKQIVSIAAPLMNWFSAQTGSGAEFSYPGITPGPTVYWEGFGTGNNTVGSGSNYAGYEPWTVLEATSVSATTSPPDALFLPPGTTSIWIESESTSVTVSLKNLLEPTVTGSTTYSATAGTWVNWTLPAAFAMGCMCDLNLTGVSGLVEFADPGIAYVPTAVSPLQGWSPNGAGTGPPDNYGAALDGGGLSNGGLPANGAANVLGGGATVQIGQGTLGGSNWVPVTPVAQVTTSPIGQNYGTYLSNLEYKAAQSAEVYWSFLRAIGYTEQSQIAPDCIIPMPYQVLPSDLNLGNLTLPELQSLYLSWLQGLGNFYNTTLSATNFCGTQSTHKFDLGGAIWGNLLVNATGDIYLNNGISPIALNGTALPSELYGNVSTWALTHEQLLLMPTLGTVHIPVGVKWEVPAGNPIEIYAVQVGQMLTARGNGTSSGGGATAFVPLGTAAPGDSIYLTSCVVGGVVQASCTVTVQTINTTSGNISCGLGATGPGSCQTVTEGGATFGGLPNPFTWLAGLFSGLFGGGSLGNFLGSLVAGLVILAVIAVLVYVAVIEVEAWGGRKRGGGGGGGGSTVVVTGGR